MRILIVHTYYYPRIAGGAEYSIKKLAEGLVARGHEVFVLCDDEQGDRDDAIGGVTVFRRRMRCVRKSRTLPMKLMRAALELYNPFNRKIVTDAVRRVKPDVVYTNSIERISTVAWSVARRLRIPILDTQRVYTLIEPADGKYRIGNGLWKRFNRAASRKVKRAAFISKTMMQAFEDAGFFPEAVREVIYNSIDYEEERVNELLERRSAAAAEREKTRFVYLGSLSEHKGVLPLLEAFESMPGDGVELAIAGDGDLRGAVEACAARDSRVRYYGWLGEEDLGQLLESCDVLVCPSIWREPFGRVVLDAYKHGMPVIASNCGGLAETVEDGVTGLTVEPGSAAALAEAFKTLSDDRALYARCCRNAAKALNRFSLENYLDQYEESLGQLTGRG